VTLYARAGLVAQGEVVSLRATSALAPTGGATAARMEDAADIVALDTRVTSMDRAKLLRALMAAHPGRVVRKDGKLLGYGIAKAYADVTEIGPVVAEDATSAWAIIDDLVRATRGPHDMVVHAVGPEARERGFVHAFRAIPMFKGGPPAWDTGRYHAVAGLEKG
jgi:hypothetical protein